MPLGLVRLNERRQRPNQNISFIKPMKGPDEHIALDILERVSAIVWPVMRENGLGVMSLEDFPPNREFWGRNFNAGECIQLVLKSPMTGLWLPFSFVCKVMLHELAHIKQMNHSRAFHAVRIGLTKEFDALTAKGYTGEGFWSKGQTVSAEFTAPRHLSEEEMPTNVCGGTYRSKAKQQKRKLTYAEQKQKRKEKLFGKGEGEIMGANPEARAELEKGKGKKAVAVKPRVAQSQRGRDLRLEAALKRQQAQAAAKAEISAAGATSQKEESPVDSSDYETEEDEETVDVGGGNRMVKVEEEGQDDNEWDEFKQELDGICFRPNSSQATASTSKACHNGKSKALGSRIMPKKDASSDSDTEESDDEIEIVPAPDPAKSKKKARMCTKPESDHEDSDTPPPPPLKKASTKQDSFSKIPEPAAGTDKSKSVLITCKVCTMENEVSLALCAACGNVLDTSRTPNWKCEKPSCRQVAYANPRDAGVCGCCGGRPA